MKKTVCAALASLAMVVSTKADLFWFNSVNILDFNGDPVAASDTDSTVGYFAQLIFAGLAPDGLTLSGNGTSGDDAVVATMFAGQNDFLFVDGIFPIQGTAAVAGAGGNGNYFVRVFNAPNLNFGDGNSAALPAGATHYFQSAVHAYAHSEFSPDNWDFAPAGGQTTMELVPEPSVMAMMAMSLLVLGKLRRRFVK
jgi:hypothetical protein